MPINCENIKFSFFVDRLNFFFSGFGLVFSILSKFLGRRFSCNFHFAGWNCRRFLRRILSFSFFSYSGKRFTKQGRPKALAMTFCTIHIFRILSLLHLLRSSINCSQFSVLNHHIRFTY